MSPLGSDRAPSAVKAFVTGGTGFIGRRLIDDLLGAGYEVTALVRTFDRARALPEAVRTIAGDVNKPASLRLGLRGADVVFHLAAWRNYGVRLKDQPRLARTNVEGTRQVLELAGELGVPRIVYTSCISVYGHSPDRLLDETCSPKSLPTDSEYERSKYRAHEEVVLPLQRQGLPIVIVCPSLVFGPGDRASTQALLRRYLQRRLPVMLSPNSARNWVYVDDVAAGHRLAAEHGRPGETYFLAGAPLSFKQFFAAAERATGLPAPRLWLPAGLASPAGALLTQANLGLSEALRSLDGPPGLASAAKAQHELGWHTRPLDDGLRATVAWLQAEAAAQAAEAAAARAALERERHA
jgi:dihydroflavonol-4-reductase